MIIATKIRIAPIIILNVKTSLNNMTENTIPQNASVDNIIAAFVSEVYFCAIVWKQYANVVEKIAK